MSDAASRSKADDYHSKADKTGLPVSGYRPQTAARIDAVNYLKQAEERVLRILDTLAKDRSPIFPYSTELTLETDKRWLAIARTQIEQGFMAANRSIFQPARITLQEDDRSES